MGMLVGIRRFCIKKERGKKETQSEAVLAALLPLPGSKRNEADQLKQLRAISSSTRWVDDLRRVELRELRGGPRALPAPTKRLKGGGSQNLFRLTFSASIISRTPAPIPFLFIFIRFVVLDDTELKTLPVIIIVIIIINYSPDSKYYPFVRVKSYPFPPLPFPFPFPIDNSPSAWLKCLLNHSSNDRFHHQFFHSFTSQVLLFPSHHPQVCWAGHAELCLLCTRLRVMQSPCTLQRTNKGPDQIRGMQ